MTTRRIYLDTEFTSLNRYQAKLISLALVVPGGGPEFYVELIDTWSPADCSSFVLDTVLPQREGQGRAAGVPAGPWAS